MSLKSVPGVDSVDVDLAKGLASVRMKPGNTTTLTELRNAITKNGFTMKNSNITVVGTVISGAATQLKISGSNETLDLLPDAQAIPATTVNNRSVAITGVVPETAKGKPFVIRYRSISEQQ